MSFVDRELDIYALKRHFERLNGVIDVVGATDLALLAHARRALLPLPLIDREPPVDASAIFPPFRSRPLRRLAGADVPIVASGGAGACVSMVGAVRAFEEAGIEPSMLSACSGGAIWSAMWAAGMDAQRMAEFSLSWRSRDYLDVRFSKLPGYALGALRGFTGLMRGEAIEQTFDERFAGANAGDLAVPLSTIVYEFNHGRVEYFGSATTPDMPVGRIVRIAIALPLMIEAVPVDGGLYVDGGIIELVPFAPVLERGGFDHVIALNFMLPPQFEPSDITGFVDRRMTVLAASRQLEQGYHLELARRARAQLGDQLTIVDPCDHRLLRGVRFYDLFIDRSRWPELMREGYERTTRALDALRRRRRPAATRTAA